MLISEKRKFIYIAVPKTGSTSIESHLLTLDTKIQRNRVPQSDGTWVSVHKHARASEIRLIMGDRMNDYTVVAFIRDPVSTAVSKYYYYRIGRGAQRARQWRINSHLMQTRLRVLSAMILPLRTWVRLYPYSMTHEFLVDDRRRLLVDKFGDFDNLQGEFERIFVGFGFASEDLKLPTINRTRSSNNICEDDVVLRRIVEKKASIDVQVFKKYTRVV